MRRDQSQRSRARQKPERRRLGNGSNAIQTEIAHDDALITSANIIRHDRKHEFRISAGTCNGGNLLRAQRQRNRLRRRRKQRLSCSCRLGGICDGIFCAHAFVGREQFEIESVIRVVVSTLRQNDFKREGDWGRDIREIFLPDRKINRAARGIPIFGRTAGCENDGPIGRTRIARKIVVRTVLQIPRTFFRKNRNPIGESICRRENRRRNESCVGYSCTVTVVSPCTANDR